MNPLKIPELTNNFKRSVEIVQVLSKYGLSGWLIRANIDWGIEKFKTPSGELLSKYSFNERIRMALEELGTTFIKVGQILSCRPDVLGQELADELSKLTSDIPADEFEDIKKIIETELGKPLKDLFTGFDEKPLASASIGQVHIARSHQGQQVVVKVQHSGVKETVQQDMEILNGLATIAEGISMLQRYRPKRLVAELRDQIFREVDFQMEARNIRQFAAFFKDDDRINIPEVFDETTSEKVLTIGFVDGKAVSKAGPAIFESLDLQKVSRDIANVYMDMIFEHGIYHCDPHPGNILLTYGQPPTLIDFGMVARIKERTREDLEDLLLAVVDNDTEFLADAVIRMGSPDEEVDRAQLADDFHDFFSYFSAQDIKSVKMGNALRRLIDIIHEHKIILPVEVSMILKVLIMLEGTSHYFDPQFSLLDLLKDHQKKLQFRRFSPENQTKKLRRLFIQTERMLRSLPQQIGNIVTKVAKGDLSIQFFHHGLDASINRLVVAMIVSSMLLSSALLLSNKVPPKMFEGSPLFGKEGISVIGVILLSISLVFGLRLLLAIKKTGDIDKQI